jgi:hypothetical protein
MYVSAFICVEKQHKPLHKKVEYPFLFYSETIPKHNTPYTGT